MSNTLSTMSLQRLDDEYQEVTRKFAEQLLVLQSGQQTPRESARTQVMLQVLTGQLGLVLNEYAHRGGQITPCLVEGPRNPSNTWSRTVPVQA